MPLKCNNFCNFPRLLREELNFQPHLVIEFLPKFHSLSNNLLSKMLLDGVFFSLCACFWFDGLIPFFVFFLSDTGC